MLVYWALAESTCGPKGIPPPACIAAAILAQSRFDHRPKVFLFDEGFFREPVSGNHGNRQNAGQLKPIGGEAVGEALKRTAIAEYEWHEDPCRSERRPSKPGRELAQRTPGGQFAQKDCQVRDRELGGKFYKPCFPRELIPPEE
jgi:hypothetical protein